MARSIIDHTKRNGKPRRKVKTGCLTCRIRKIKCDEIKPHCQKCVDTGRTCDGYESPFRIQTSQSLANKQAISIKSDCISQSILPTFSGVAPQDISLLNRYFSTKTLFDVKLDCDQEAGQILQASLKEPPIRHAVLSLRALREDLEAFGDKPVSVSQQSPVYHYGLQQYSLALRGLASNLSSMSSGKLQSALLCCQILISIEQVRKNYAAMAQHLIQGIRIMHEYRARPCLLTMNRLASANHQELPLVDVFVIKLFAAPCRFAEPSETTNVCKEKLLESADSPSVQPDVTAEFRTIAPNNRTELLKIAALTLEFLDEISQVKSVQIALRLLSKKAALLDSLEAWLVNLEFVERKNGALSVDSFPVSFLRFFHLILRVVLLGALESTSKLNIKLDLENSKLQHFANNLSERVKNYVTCNGSSPR